MPQHRLSNRRRRSQHELTKADLHRPRLRREGGLHTLYISPLKALAVDIARNLETPVAEMELPIRIETRTGDTPASKRQRQRRDPPHILLTTPEQLALILASPDAPYLFGSLRRVVLDELHSLVIVQARRSALARAGAAVRAGAGPDDRRPVGDGRRARRPAPLPACRKPPNARRARRSRDRRRRRAAARHHARHRRTPALGRAIRARHAIGEIYGLIKQHKTTLVFVNTRSQAEAIFQQLWGINDDNLAIALHHGSLDVAQRRKVEAAMAVGRLRAVVCTSSLDLGVDWGDVDLVINVGAPKGASRLLQRIGRANHRMDEPSRGVLIPANRFEVLECTAALGAIADKAQDTPPLRTGALDVLAQHVLGSRLRRAVPRRRALRRGAQRRALCRAHARRFRRRARFRRHRRLCAEGLRALRQDQAGQGRPLAHRASDDRAALPHECRHHRRGRHAEGAAGAFARLEADPARRPAARRGRGIFHRDADARRHLRVRRRDAAIRGDRRGRGLCLARGVRRPEGAVLRRRQISALDLSRRPRAQDRGRRHAQWRGLPDAGARMAGDPGMALAAAGPARSPGRDLPARQQILPRLLSVRGPSCASDARHAADATAGARAAAPDGLSSPTNMRWRSGASATWRCAIDAASCRSPNCSTRTCWATISKPGSPNPR